MNCPKKKVREQQFQYAMGRVNGQNDAAAIANKALGEKE